MIVAVSANKCNIFPLNNLVTLLSGVPHRFKLQNTHSLHITHKYIHESQALLLLPGAQSQPAAMSNIVSVSVKFDN